MAKPRKTNAPRTTQNSDVGHKRHLPSGELAPPMRIACSDHSSEPDLLLELTRGVPREVIRQRFLEAQEPHEPTPIIPRNSHLSDD